MRSRAFLELRLLLSIDQKCFDESGKLTSSQPCSIQPSASSQGHQHPTIQSVISMIVRRHSARLADATFLADSLGSPDQQPSSGGRGRGGVTCQRTVRKMIGDSQLFRSDDSEEEDLRRRYRVEAVLSIRGLGQWEVLTPKERAQIMKLSLYEHRAR